MMKNVLSILDIKDEIKEIISLGINIKNNKININKIKELKDKTLLMIFERESTRTRVSFEVGMNKLGGNSIFLNRNCFDINQESIELVSNYISQLCDVAIYRPIWKENLYKLAECSTIPVINALDIEEHPCQILADFMTIQEHKGRLSDLNFVFVGDGDNNLAHTYLLGCLCVGADITIISPKKYWPQKNYLKKAKNLESISKCNFMLTENLNEIKNADVVATDTWVSYWDEKDRNQRVRDFSKYTITNELMKKTRKDAVFMHCMPINYGEEVEKEVVYNSKSVVFDEAENRLWTQMALLIKLFQK